MDMYNAYAKTEVSAMDQLGLEARALIKTASVLNDIKEHWKDKQADLPTALDKNRLLWTVIAGDMREENSPQPLEIKNNILNLALFIFKRTLNVLSEPTPEKLDILITINMNIAKGLSENKSEPSMPATEAKPKPIEPL